MEKGNRGDTISDEVLEKEIDRVAYEIYATECDKSIERGHPQPSYSLEELRKWIKEQPNVKELFIKWIESSNDKSDATRRDRFNRITWLKPSIDRIDSRKSYELNNIQLTTTGYNTAKGTLETKALREGKDPTDIDLSKIPEEDPQYEPVIQFTKYGKEVARYKSITEAGKLTKLDPKSISAAANGRQYIAKGYIWIKEREYTDQLLKSIVDKIPDYAIDMYDGYTGEYVKSFDTPTDAAKEMGVKLTNVSACANKRSDALTTGGMIYLYAKDKGKEDRIKFVLANKPTKLIREYALNGEHLNTYNGVYEAAKATNTDPTNISECVNKSNPNRVTANKKFWVYDNEPDIDNYINNLVRRYVKNHNTPFIYYDMYGNNVKTYHSVSEAAKDFNTSNSTIARVINGSPTNYKDRVLVSLNDPDHVKKVKERLADVHDKKKFKLKRKVEAYDKDGKLVDKFSRLDNAAIKMNVNPDKIIDNINGVTDECCGLVWKFVKRKQ